MKKNFGSVYFEGKEYYLSGEAYACGAGSDSDKYAAPAVDLEGNEYKVYWEILPEDGWNVNDESGHCDWDSPCEISKI